MSSSSEIKFFFIRVRKMWVQGPQRWFRPPETTGTGLKDPEIDGKRKQYSGMEDRGIIRRLPAVSHREEQEFDRKAPERSKKFTARNTSSMKSSEFPGTDRFLTVVSDLGGGASIGGSPPTSKYLNNWRGVGIDKFSQAETFFFYHSSQKVILWTYGWRKDTPR